MPTIPLLSGIRTSQRADFVQTYPINLDPVSLENGISKGYLRSTAGATLFGIGPGMDRGGIVFNDALHRVMGTKLVKVDGGGNVTVLGDVGGSGPVSFALGFGRLGIRSGTTYWYWDGATLVQLTDPDLGQCIDLAWLNGQFFSTDGTYVIATDINDPTSVNPVRYGSAESDPDKVTGLLPLRGEMYVFGKTSIEVQNYVGGSNFPLQSNPGATIPIGCVGPLAKTLYAESFAFVGAARNDGLAVWIASGGGATKISTRAIDDLLAAEVNPAGIQLERRVSRDEQKLIVHLSDRSVAFYRSASQKAGVEVWQELRSGREMNKAYRLRNAVYVNGQWICGDTESNKLGVLDEATGEQFGEAVGWQFQTDFTYNQANGFIVHALELIGLPGRGQAGDAAAFMSYTKDGQIWSQERAISLGSPNQRQKRVQWRPHSRMGNYAGFKFRGDSSALAGWAALEATVEPLAR